MKTTINLIIEGSDAFTNRQINRVFERVKNAPTIFGDICKMTKNINRSLVKFNLNVGRGGNHIWIADSSDKRIAIIEFR